MKFINKLTDFHSEKETAITFGKFDGIHIGHQTLINKVIEYSVLNHVEGVVCAFDMSHEKNTLMTCDEKEEILFGKIDYYVNCPFTKEFRDMSAEDFIKEIIHDIFHAKYVVVGTDFRFGKNRRGDVHMLDQYADKYGYCLKVFEKKEVNGKIVSSTYIRDELKNGNIAFANYLMGHRYKITGEVLHGRSLGHTLGFPTMNVEWPILKVVPPRGVYFGRVHVRGKWYPAVCNVGVRPTVCNENKDFAECYLLGFSGDAYGEIIRVEFLEFRRSEMKFKDLDELKETVDKDIVAAKQYFEII